MVMVEVGACMTEWGREDDMCMHARRDDHIWPTRIRVTSDDSFRHDNLGI